MWSDDLNGIFKIAFYQVFDNFNVNLRKNEGFLTCIPYIPIPEYGQSKAPLSFLFLGLVIFFLFNLCI